MVILAEQPPTLFKRVVIGSDVADAHEKLLAAAISSRARVGAHPNLDDRKRNADSGFSACREYTEPSAQQSVAPTSTTAPTGSTKRWPC